MRKKEKNVEMLAARRMKERLASYLLEKLDDIFGRGTYDATSMVHKHSNGGMCE